MSNRRIGMGISSTTTSLHSTKLSVAAIWRDANGAQKTSGCYRLNCRTRLIANALGTRTATDTAASVGGGIVFSLRIYQRLGRAGFVTVRKTLSEIYPDMERKGALPARLACVA
jgi:hypothetical protein